MMYTLNLGQSIYAQCKSLVGPLPGRGTMVFALSFFVHRALGHTDRTDADGVPNCRPAGWGTVLFVGAFEFAAGAGAGWGCPVNNQLNYVSFAFSTCLLIPKAVKTIKTPIPP